MGERRHENRHSPELGKPCKDGYHWKAWCVAVLIGIAAGLLGYQSRPGLLEPLALRPEVQIDVDNLLSYANITVEATAKRFHGETLGFVTPWNHNGYDFATKFSKKFSMISPVWYQIAPGNILTGSHHFDEQWLEGLRRNNCQIVPRLNMEGWQLQDIFYLLQDATSFVDEIVQEIEKRRYDGVVLEATQAMFFADHLQATITDIRIPSFAESVLVKLAFRFRSLNKKLVIVASPESSISKRDAMAAYSEFVSHVVVMTYDYGIGGRIGPNAPINWVRKTITEILRLPGIRPHQVLLGLNFYGNDHVGAINEARKKASRPVIASEYIELISNPYNQAKSVTYLELEKEHYLRYLDVKGEEHSVFFPSLKSIQERILLAEELGVGIQIWEIGQGFECFFDLL